MTDIYVLACERFELFRATVLSLQPHDGFIVHILDDESRNPIISKWSRWAKAAGFIDSFEITGKRSGYREARRRISDTMLLTQKPFYFATDSDVIWKRGAFEVLSSAAQNLTAQGRRWALLGPSSCAYYRKRWADGCRRIGDFDYAGGGDAYPPHEGSVCVSIPALRKFPELWNLSGTYADSWRICKTKGLESFRLCVPNLTQHIGAIEPIVSRRLKYYELLFSNLENRFSQPLEKTINVDRLRAEYPESVRRLGTEMAAERGIDLAGEPMQGVADG